MRQMRVMNKQRMSLLLLLTSPASVGKVLLRADSMAVVRHLFIPLLLLQAVITSAAAEAEPSCALSHLYFNVSMVTLLPRTGAQLQLMDTLISSPCNAHLLSPPSPTAGTANEMMLSHRYVTEYIEPNFSPSAYRVTEYDLGPILANAPSQNDVYHPDNNNNPNEQDFDFYNAYHSLSVLVRKWKHLARKYDTVRLSQYGKSIENRSLLYLQYTPPLSSSCLSLKRVFLNGAQHAREWVTPAVTTYVIEQLAKAGEGGGGSGALIAKCVQVICVPVSNPDGYEYTRVQDRLWRKNRRFGLPCDGVDLNRNWDIDYGGLFSTSTNTCSNEYIGQYAFSEPETRHLRDLFQSVKPHAHVDIHSYGRDILAAYQFSAVDVTHYKLLDAVAHAMQKAMTEPYSYSRGAENTVLYKASGFMSDWAFAQGVLSYTVEVSPAGDEVPNFAVGFFLPEHRIKRVCQDFVMALTELSKYAASAPANLNEVGDQVDDSVLTKLTNVVVNRQSVPTATFSGYSPVYMLMGLGLVLMFVSFVREALDRLSIRMATQEEEEEEGDDDEGKGLLSSLKSKKNRR